MPVSSGMMLPFPVNQNPRACHASFENWERATLLVMASSRWWLLPAAFVITFLSNASAQQVPAIVLSRIAVEYPSIAQSARVRGTVSVRVGVRPDGSIAETTLLDGVPLLNDAAINAASRASFECRGCTDPSTPHTIAFVFSFDHSEGLGHAPPPAWRQTGDASSEVTVFGRSFLCPHCPRPFFPARAAGCLWLWHCGRRYVDP
jgi:TonB family protein